MTVDSGLGDRGERHQVRQEPVSRRTEAISRIVGPIVFISLIAGIFLAAFLIAPK